MLNSLYSVPCSVRPGIALEQSPARAAERFLLSGALCLIVSVTQSRSVKPRVAVGAGPLYGRGFGP